MVWKVAGELVIPKNVKPAAGLRAHLTEEEGVRSEACRDTRSDS
jgi:hypothetical protein